MEQVSENFCVIPFIHLSSKTDGSARLCCFSTQKIKDKRGKTLFLGKDSLEEIWNSFTMRDVRKKMLEGKRLEGCRKCWNEEETGKYSKRQRENDRFFSSNQKRLKDIVQNDGALSEYPFFLDLRFGNLCNLRCRTCSPLISSAWQTEIRKHYDDLDRWQVLKDTYKGSFESAEKMTTWYKANAFLETIKRISKDIKILHFSGGEPLLIKECLDLIDYFLENGSHRHITIQVHSNMTKLSADFLDKLCQFENVVFAASIDSKGEKNDWLRFPGKFSQIQENTERLLEKSAKHRHFFSYINCTISAYNILYMNDTIEWSRRLSDKFNAPDFRVAFDMLHEPKFQHISVLTESLKQKAICRLNEIKDTYILHEAEENGIDSCLAILNSSLEDNEEIVELRKQLKEHTLAIDRWRKENFFSVFPEFKGELV